MLFDKDAQSLEHCDTVNVQKKIRDTPSDGAYPFDRKTFGRKDIWSNVHLVRTILDQEFELIIILTKGPSGHLPCDFGPMAT